MSDAQQDRDQADALPAGDIIGVLYRQHADVRDLMAQIAKAEGDTRQNGFDKLKTMLKAHETAEQKILRPVTRETAGVQETDQRNQEEAKADQVLAELGSLDAAGPDFAAKFADFTKAVSDHAEAEEHQEFPTVLASRSIVERIQLGKAFLEEFARAFGA